MKKDRKVKEKRIKKKLSAETSSNLTFLIVILVTLGTTIPLHIIFPDKLSSYWVIAICVAVISPFALANFKINMISKGNYTEEQKKAATSNLGIMMLSIWYADFTFICMFMNWLIAFFVLAGLYLIKMIYDVASVLVNRKDATTYPNFLIISDFALSFLLLTLLIYKIPDQTLQTIVIALTAALIGGLLTLLGVMLTIKKSDQDRKLENRMKNRPIMIIVESHSIGCTSCNINKSGSIKEEKDNKANLGFIMKNISSMPCRVVGASYMNRIIECFDNHLWVENQEMVWLHIQAKDFKYDGTIKLLLEDISGYQHEYLLTYDSAGDITSMKDITDMEAK